MTQISDAYAAAWIEARGSIEDKGGSPQYNPMVTVVSVGRDVTRALREQFGGGKLDYFSPRSSPHMTLYTWKIRGTPAVDALRRTIPHMITDLRDDAEDAVER